MNDVRYKGLSVTTAVVYHLANTSQMFTPNSIKATSSSRIIPSGPSDLEVPSECRACLTSGSSILGPSLSVIGSSGPLSSSNRSWICSPHLCLISSFSKREGVPSLFLIHPLAALFFFFLKCLISLCVSFVWFVLEKCSILNYRLVIIMYLICKRQQLFPNAIYSITNCSGTSQAFISFSFLCVLHDVADNVNGNIHGEVPNSSMAVGSIWAHPPLSYICYRSVGRLHTLCYSGDGSVELSQAWREWHDDT